MLFKRLFLGGAIASLALAKHEGKIRKRDWMEYNNIDSSATSGAQVLLKYLQQQFGWHYLSGQQEATEVAWVKKYVGKTPAIQGNDFIDYSPSRVAYGATSDEVENAMSFNSAGGINAWVWHWNAPTCLYNTASEPWWSGFYTAATCFDVQEALNEGPSGANYKLLLRDIDAIAVQIKRLSDANIPFLWRPLHEPDGEWFWWGAKGPGPFLQLWDLLYDRITSYHGLHNMVWVCNTMNPAWYPGNDKCDIVTTDIYASAGDHNVQASSWSDLYGLSNGERIIALAEVGVIPDPELQASQNIPWAYWMTWSGTYIEGGSYNSIQFLYDVYSDSHVVTLDGTTPLGNWKSTPI
jgi:mannan endo-1,4-beta-mannosidase